MKDDGGSAFPLAFVSREDGSGVVNVADGMSLCDWFAGKAMQGLLQRNEVVPRYCGEWSEERAADVCADAYRIAKAMLAEREK